MTAQNLEQKHSMILIFEESLQISYLMFTASYDAGLFSFSRDTETLITMKGRDSCGLESAVSISRAVWNFPWRLGAPPGPSHWRRGYCALLNDPRLPRAVPIIL